MARYVVRFIGDGEIHGYFYARNPGNKFGINWKPSLQKARLFTTRGIAKNTIPCKWKDQIEVLPVKIELEFTLEMQKCPSE